ncbi:MAG: TOBE domain-containing protein, partial [Gaiellaceae bacterium]
TFLGSVTRIQVGVGGGEVTADVSTNRAATLPVGHKVRATFPAESARVLSLLDALVPEVPVEADP